MAEIPTAICVSGAATTMTFAGGGTCVAIKWKYFDGIYSILMSVRCQFIFVLACNKPNCVRKQGAEKWAIELDAAES